MHDTDVQPRGGQCSCCLAPAVAPARGPLFIRLSLPAAVAKPVARLSESLIPLGHTGRLLHAGRAASRPRRDANHAMYRLWSTLRSLCEAVNGSA